MAYIKLSAESFRQSDALAFLDILGEPLTTDEGKPVDLIVYRLSDLSLPSGQIIASDGLIMNNEPFSQHVEVGSYPLFLAIADFNGDERIAFALLRFTQSPVASWEMAVVKGQDASKLDSDQIFGYGVDSGTGCFCDPGAQQIINELSDPDMKFCNHIINEMQQSYKHTRSWISIETPRGSAALFSSGYGDGCYASYFGLDSSGKVVALVTDFGIVDWPRRPKMQ